MNDSNPYLCIQESKHKCTSDNSDTSYSNGSNRSNLAALGTVTKTTSPLTPTGVLSPEIIDPCTGEIFQLPETGFQVKNDILTPSDFHMSQLSRANRWALKSVVNKLLPDIRTSKCMVFRAPLPDGGVSDIKLCRGTDTKKAYYHGLMSCGSIWTCPICAAKVSERRRQELKSALQVAKDKDLRAHFVTLTFPHGISDDLNDILTKMSQAFKRLSAGKYSVKNSLARLDSNLGIEGFIRAIEVTHGKNGFHPHIHMIVFTNSDTYSGHLKMVYGESWLRACRLAGLPIPSFEHGCTVQDGSFASDYVSKWGIEDEMTKSNAKKGKTKGLSPWGLLGCVLDGDNPDYPAKKAGDLFRVYASSFSGRRQLYWSNGLRKRLELAKEVTDQELVDKIEDDRASVLANITVEQWKAIRGKGAQSYLLDLGESHPERVSAYISHLVNSVNISKVGPDSIPKYVSRSSINDNQGIDERTRAAMLKSIEYRKTMWWLTIKGGTNA